MATAYSDEIAIGSYNRIRIKCDYSGTSATLTIQFRRTSAYTGTWGDAQATLVFNGQSKAAAYNYSGTVGTSWVDLRAAISGYTIPSSGGTFNWSFNNPGGSSVLGCSGTLYIPSQGSAPSNGYINDLEAYWSNDEQQIVLHTAAAGCNDGGLTLSELSLKFGITPYTDSGWPDDSTQATYLITNGAAKSVSNNTSRYSGTLSIIGNKQYYSAIFASNSAGSYRFKTANGAPVIVTPPPVGDLWVTANNDTPTTKQIGVWFPTNGGYYPQTFQYRLNGGEWITGVTKTGENSETKYVVITGLTPHTSYTVETRITTTAGTTNGKKVSFMTNAASKMELYGSASSVATHINKLYCRPGSENFFNKNGTRAAYSACTYTVSGEEITLTGNSSNSGYKWYMVVVRGTDALIGKQITVSYDMKTVGSHTSDIRIFWGNSTDTGYSSLVPNTDDIKTTNNQFVHVAKTFTLPDRPSDAGSLLLSFYSNISSAASAVTVFRNVMVKLGADATFVPYNGEEATSNYYDSTQVTSYAGITTTGNVAYYILNGTVTTADQRVYTGSTITLPAGTYTFKQEYISGSHSNATPSMWLYVGPNTWTRPFTDSCYVSASRPTFTKTFTLSEPASLRLALYTRANETYTDYKARISIVAGSTAGDFEPYIGRPGARAICKLYGSVNGVAKLIFARHTQE